MVRGPELDGAVFMHACCVHADSWPGAPSPWPSQVSRSLLATESCKPPASLQQSRPRRVLNAGNASDRTQGLKAGPSRLAPQAPSFNLLQGAVQVSSCDFAHLNDFATRVSAADAASPTVSAASQHARQAMTAGDRTSRNNRRPLGNRRLRTAAP
jgi:hypothetical protein